MVIRLRLVREPGNRKLIALYEAFTTQDSLLSGFPLLGWLYGSVFRRGVGIGISTLMAGSGTAWKIAAKGYDMAFALIGADSVPPPHSSNGIRR